MRITGAFARRVLASRYVEGAREVGVALDCLGTTLAIAAALGLPADDPWSRLSEVWRRGDACSPSGFPDGWHRVSIDHREAIDGDVFIFNGSRHQWVAIVADGYVWSADGEIGSTYRRLLSRWARVPSEVWRHGEDHRS